MSATNGGPPARPDPPEVSRPPARPGDHLLVPIEEDVYPGVDWFVAVPAHAWDRWEAAHGDVIRAQTREERRDQGLAPRSPLILGGD